MTKQKWILRSLVILLTQGLMACSGVEFNPGVLEKNTTDGNIQDKTANESFYPNPTDSRAKVDILFVIDNSASMADIQAKLGDRLSAFIGSLENVDWQIGITTTDTSDGPFGLKGSLIQLYGLNQFILNKNTPNYEFVFKNTVVRPEGINCVTTNCPSRVERPIDAATLAITKNEAGLLRPGAELAIVVLTDSDEGGGFLNQTVTVPQDFLNVAAQLFNQQKRVTAYGIIVEPGDTDCFQERRNSSPYSSYGNYITLLTNLTGGVTGSVCDTNYTQSLKKIGDHVLNLASSITLSQSPKEGSVEITLSPADPQVTWTIEDKTIKFVKAPKAGTRVDVKYIIDDGTY